MKRIIALLCIAALVLTIAGCSQLDALKDVELPAMPTATPVPTATPEPTEAPAETAVETVEPDGTLILITVRQTEELRQAPDGSGVQILSFRYETPFVSVEGNAQATAKVNDVFSLADEAFYTGTEFHGATPPGFNIMLEQAEENYHANQDGTITTNVSFECSRLATIVRADSELIHIRLTTYMYLGQGEGESYTEDYFFDTKTGEELSDQNDAGEAPERTAQSPEVVIQDAGSLPEQTAILDLIEIDPDGNDLYLFFTGKAYDVCLKYVEYSGVFYDTGLVWYASELRDCAIELRALIPEGMPNLVLEYTTADNTIVKLLVTENGMNGMPALVAAEAVEAVG